MKNIRSKVWDYYKAQDANYTRYHYMHTKEYIKNRMYNRNLNNINILLWQELNKSK
jgi:hypothetical protein